MLILILTLSMIVAQIAIFLRFVRTLTIQRELRRPGLNLLVSGLGGQFLVLVWQLTNGIYELGSGAIPVGRATLVTIQFFALCSMLMIGLGLNKWIQGLTSISEVKNLHETISIARQANAILALQQKFVLKRMVTLGAKRYGDIVVACSFLISKIQDLQAQRLVKNLGNAAKLAAHEAEQQAALLISSTGMYDSVAVTIKLRESVENLLKRLEHEALANQKELRCSSALQLPLEVTADFQSFAHACSIVSQFLGAYLEAEKFLTFQVQYLATAPHRGHLVADFILPLDRIPEAVANTIHKIVAHEPLTEKELVEELIPLSLAEHLMLCSDGWIRMSAEKNSEQVTFSCSIRCKNATVHATPSVSIKDDFDPKSRMLESKLELTSDLDGNTCNVVS